MRQLYVDYENKCQNFIRQAVPCIDALYGAHQEKATFPLQVHIFYRADTPRKALPPAEREWLAHHAVHSTTKNAADKALLRQVASQLAAYTRDPTAFKQKASTMTVVCGGDKNYEKKLGEWIRVVLDGDHGSLLEFVP